MMDPSCGYCTSSDCRGNAGYTNEFCPEHGDLAQACIDPKDLDQVVAGIVEDAPGVHEATHLKMVMSHYKGKANPRVVLGKIRTRAR